MLYVSDMAKICCCSQRKWIIDDMYVDAQAHTYICIREKEGFGYYTYVPSEV